MGVNKTPSNAFIDYIDKPIELITPFRHKPTQNDCLETWANKIS